MSGAAAKVLKAQQFVNYNRIYTIGVRNEENKVRSNRANAEQKFLLVKYLLDDMLF